MADWKRLGAFVNSGRTALGFSSTKKFAAYAKLTARTLDKVEAGEGPFAPTTLSKLEDAFNWEPGSCDLICGGSSPQFIIDPPLHRLHQIWAMLSYEQRVSLVAGLESMLGLVHKRALDGGAPERGVPGSLA